MTRKEIYWIVHDYILNLSFAIYKLILVHVKHPDFTHLLVHDRLVK